MLSRAAIRTLRLSESPSLLRSRLLPLQSRHYSSKGKPGKPFEYQPPKSNFAHSDGSRIQGAAGPTSKPVVGPTSRAPFDVAQLEENFRNMEEQIKEFQDSSPQISDLSTNHPPLRDGVTPYPDSTDNANPQPTIRSSETPGQSVHQNPSQPLPDLTQGIPSTLDAEPSSSQRADSDILNITEDPASGGRKGGGDLPKTAYISSLERKRTRLARFLYGLVVFGIASTTLWWGRNWEDEELERLHPEAPSGWGLGLFYNRVRARMRDTLDYYNEPAFPKLLPNIDPAWERPYTLVLSLEDLLVHSEWSREHGWRMAKRPGVDYFLRYLSQYYELVIWTSNQSMIAQPIIQKLDPYHVVMWPLFREATRYQKGEYIKDLSYLNRDLKKVLMVDTDPSHAKSQPENAIILPKWKGNIHDKDLVSLIPFLEYCAAMNFGDLRAVLKSFEGKHIPTEFARRETIARERFQKEAEQDRSKRPKRSMGFLSSLTGPSKSQMIAPDGTELPSWSAGMEQGKTYQDLVRERGQKQYELLEKEIKQNGEKWLKEMAEEEKKANEEVMKGMKSTFTSYVPFIGGRRAESGEGSKGGKPA